MMMTMPRKETLKEELQVAEYAMPLFVRGWWIGMRISM
jgi:hypothetical protein